jgi:hypothetical protein
MLIIDDDFLIEYILGNRAGGKIKYWEHFRDIRLRRERMRKTRRMRENKKYYCQQLPIHDYGVCDIAHNKTSQFSSTGSTYTQ